MIATGRRPFTDKLNADKIGVKIDNKGRIEINDKFETNVKGIFAIGDVVEFTQRNGTVVQGTVRKKAIKNVTVETTIGNWKVPAHMLTIV